MILIFDKYFAEQMLEKLVGTELYFVAEEFCGAIFWIVSIKQEELDKRGSELVLSRFVEALTP